jgi:formate-nitrite transporter family protein
MKRAHNRAADADSNAKGRSRDEAKHSITEREAEDVEERSTPRTPGHLRDRPPARLQSLWWSGVAAGMSISFSLLAEAILQVHLPDVQWRLLITGFGYPVGFVMVVMSRQQLFTETTVTAVLPVIADFNSGNLARLARMLTIVFSCQFSGNAVRRFVFHVHAGAYK